ncbi:MAG TPA: ATP-grasp domain-containing protein [Burkholderiaceae bacterium]|nr:ATP-grasp domain-containing protein [Burkholderiaceae bacterium]
MITSEFALLIGADLSLRERAILCTARALAMPVVLLAFPGKQRPANTLADDIIECEHPMNPALAVDAVRRYSKERGIRPAAVIPINDFSLKAGAAVARAFGLRFLHDDVIARCRDKVLMKRAFDAAGLRSARVLAQDEAVLDYDFPDGKPVILKPSEFGGSGGVRLVSNRAELRSAWDTARTLLDKYAEAAHVDPRRIHLEEFLESDKEVSVEVYCTPGRATVAAVTEKFLSPPPYFAEVGHRVPYPGSDGPELAEVGRRACMALGIDRGVAHVEIRILPDGCYVIEVGARPGGDKIMDLVHRARGIDLYALHAQSYVDRWHVTLPSTAQGVAAIGFLKAAPGRIADIRTPSAAEGLYDLSVYKRVGDRSEPLSHFETREGHAEWFWPAHRETPDFIAMTDRLADQIFVIEHEAA